MKANAPEKIYFSANENGTHYFTEGIPFGREYIEYIRTDAFIEKAYEFFAPYISDNSGGYERAAVIEDFKNYIKEE